MYTTHLYQCTNYLSGKQIWTKSSKLWQQLHFVSLLVFIGKVKANFLIFIKEIQVELFTNKFSHLSTQRYNKHSASANGTHWLLHSYERKSADTCKREGKSYQEEKKQPF